MVSDDIGAEIGHAMDVLQDVALDAPPLVPPEDQPAFWATVAQIAREAGRRYRSGEVVIQARPSGITYRLSVRVEDVEGAPSTFGVVGTKAPAMLDRLRHVLIPLPKVVNLRDYGAGGVKPRPWGPFDLPDHVVRVDRGSKYGNQYPIGGMYDREVSLALYARYLDERLAKEPEYLEPLRGKGLACWCRPPEGFRGRLLCHAQIIVGRLYGIAPEAVE